MKTEFRKLILMTKEGRREPLTSSMQELGLLHIAQDSIDIPEETETLIHKLNLIKRVVRFLEAETNPHQEIQKPEGDRKTEKQVIQALQKIEEQVDEIHQKIEKLEKKLNQLALWGDYDYTKFKRIIDEGLHIFLCRADKKQFEQIDRSNAVIEVINRKGSVFYFVAITDQEEYDTTFESFSLPKNAPSEIREQVQALHGEEVVLTESLQEYVAYLPDLRSLQTQTNDAISLTETQANFQEHFDGKLISISSWFPAPKEKEIVRFLEKEQVAWTIREPEKGENVPVVLENKKYPGLFEPITRIFELPNYYETDLTPFLAVFYPILFAYCLGDAGYGFVLTAAMLIGYFSFLRDTPKAAVLGTILGSVTLVMGLIKSGSLFGVMLLPDHPVGWIRELSAWVVIPDDSSVVFNAFNVALMIGVIQIITGVIISIYNKLMYAGLTRAIAPVGKLLIVTCLIWIFLADMQEMKGLDVFGDLRKYVLIAGVVLVVLFHDPEISILKRIGSSFMPLFFIFTGILGDILSYVRLFALGLASSVLGLVVNQIGLQIMDGGIVNIIVGILFLLFGHALNFGIAALGSFVHPLRLTFVEFYGNVGFQGKGLAYRPFKKSKQTL